MKTRQRTPYKLINRIVGAEQGSSLLLVLLVLVVTSILGMALMGITINNVKMSSVESANQSAFYIAEAGINSEMPNLSQHIMDIYAVSATESEYRNALESHFYTNYAQATPTIIGGFTESFGELPEARVWIEADLGVVNQYKLISQGFVGQESRVVEKPFTLSWIPKGGGVNLPTDMAIFADGQINMPNGTINGPVGTNASVDGAIIVSGGAAINGEIYGGPGSTEDLVDKPDWKEVGIPSPMLEEIVLEMPPFPIFPGYAQRPNEMYNSYEVVRNGDLRIDDYRSNNYTLTLNSNTSFNHIILKSNYTLFIDVGNMDRDIVVNHLDVSNGHIEIIGSGKLTFYVQDRITMGSGSTINNHGDSKQLEVIYRGTSPLKLAGSQKIFGSLFAESADLEITGGGGFQGNIITGGSSLKISGGGAANVQVIYAPYAHAMLSGGGTVNGSIIANTFDITGGSEVRYPESGIDPDDLPFLPGEGGSVSIDDLLDSTKPARES